ncbi:hypothetical protein PLICRDRAFT_61796, partial [Plicaturopsis crispa FD-325 SS-3]
GGNAARGDDAGKLKTSIVAWIAELYVIPIPPIDPNSKLERGLEHDATGALLCPVDFDWTHESVRVKIRNAHPNFLVTADRWPAFLYEKIGDIDMENVEKGFLKGKLLLKARRRIAYPGIQLIIIQAAKSLLTSPSSAHEIIADEDTGNADNNDSEEPPKKKRKREKTTTRSSIAQLMGLDAITSRIIAYLAVQVRFALSNVGSWRDSDGDFDYIEFYHNIIDFFENPAGPIAAAANQELLDWW